MVCSTYGTTVTAAAGASPCCCCAGCGGCRPSGCGGVWLASSASGGPASPHSGNSTKSLFSDSGPVIAGLLGDPPAAAQAAGAVGAAVPPVGAAAPPPPGWASLATAPGGPCRTAVCAAVSGPRLRWMGLVCADTQVRYSSWKKLQGVQGGKGGAEAEWRGEGGE